MRKYYIDNLRNLTILLLFLVHTLMIWNNFGSKFYIWLGENKVLSTIIVLINPWFMPLLFILAGISAKYALEKRTKKEFINERIKKLLIPFIFGTIFLVPIQTFFARKFFYGYDGNLIKNEIYFFTHLTDLTGYDGAFTVGHLWFILFLFIISIFSLIIFNLIPLDKITKGIEKLSVFKIFLLFIPIYIMYHLGNFGGFSLGKSLTLFLIGYYILSNDNIIDKVEFNFKFISVLFAICTVISGVLYYKYSYYGDLWINFIGWISILFLIVLGKKFFNKSTNFTKYFNKASYPIYILHQSILVALAYYIVQICNVLFIQVFLICFGSFILTMLSYWIIKRVSVIKNLFGIA